MINPPQTTNFKSETTIYQNSNGSLKINIETINSQINGQIWLRQIEIAQIFGIERTVASKYIKQVFRDEELDKQTNIQKNSIPNSENLVTLYSLEVVIAVGFRLSGTGAIRFRQWANTILKNQIVKK